MRRPILILLAFVSGLLKLWAQEGSIHYTTPLSYQKQGEDIVVSSRMYLKGGIKGLIVFRDGVKVPYKSIAKDTVELQLPLIGSTSKLIIKRKGKSDLVKVFTPLVPDDWKYFKEGTIHIIVSSHQDIAWMNTPEYCREERIHDIILPALDTMDLYDEYRFEMEQTLNLMELLDEYPEKKPVVLNAYQKGQFEWGATFNQPYEGIESGEQLIRQLYLGRKWIRDNIPGMDARTAFNVDVPGRSFQFPQILNKGGVKNLVISRFKEGFYHWKSPDGSRIFTYSPGNYGWPVIFYKYFEKEAPYGMKALHANLKDWHDYYEKRNIPPHYAVMISQDASGPIYYREVIKEWNNIVSMSGIKLPRLRHSTADEFLSFVNVPEAEFDEIYGERANIWMYIHGPGHYQAIRAKKQAAVSLPAAEMFSTISAMINDDFNNYPGDNFEQAWFKAIYPDHGWGGLNGGITDSTFLAKLSQADEEGIDILQGALKDITKHIKTTQPNGYAVFNDLTWNRNAAISISLPSAGKAYSVKNDVGKTIPSQKVTDDKGTRLIVAAEDISSVGYNVLYLSETAQKNNTEARSAINFYENDYYRVTLGNGGITSLYDKELDQDILNTSRYAGGDVISMHYDGHGAGEFNQMKKPTEHNLDKLSLKNSSWTVKSSGPVFTSFECDYKLNGMPVIQRITIFNNMKRIDFEYDIPEWDGRKERQWRFALPMNAMEVEVNYESPAGVVTVGKDDLDMEPGGWSWEGTYRQMPKYIHPREVLDFMSLNGPEFGITVSGTVAVMDWVDPKRDARYHPVLQGIMLSTHKSCHGMGPYYTQEGRHTFHFSLTSHESGWENGYVFAREFQHEPWVVKLPDSNTSGKLGARNSFIKVSSPFAFVSTFKKSDYDHDVILRLTEMSGTDSRYDVDFQWNFKKWGKTNLVEESYKEIDPNGGKTLSVSMGQNAIETFKIGF